MKSTARNVVIPFAASMLVCACARDDGPARTVSWYQQHPEERKAMVARCADDPGRLGSLPNCVNAQQAAGIEDVGSLKDLPPLGLDPNHQPGFEPEKKTPVRP